MEVIVGVNSDYKNYKLVDVDTGEDITRFCWAADDEAGLYALFDNDGKSVLATKAVTVDEADERGERYIESYTYEGNIRLVKV